MSSAKTSAAQGESRRRGRPATLSRERVLAGALELTGQRPDGDLSLKALARHLDVTPMAIYTYFSSKDELMQALSAHQFEDLVVDIPSDATPMQRVVSWSRAIRRHFNEHPPLINMLQWDGRHTSVAWLNQSRPLFDALDELDLTEDEYAQMARWVFNAIMNTIQLELYERRITPKDAEAVLADLAPPVRSRVEMIRRCTAVDDYLDRYFDFQLERIEEAIGRWPKRAAVKSKAKTART